MSDRDLAAIAQFYEKSIRRMWRLRKGGELRTAKGKITETLCEMIAAAAARREGLDDRVRTERGRSYLLPAVPGGDKGYLIQQDRQVFLRDRLAISVECKAYAEVAMLKRVLIDSYLMRDLLPPAAPPFFCLLQLENFMGGDYGTKIENPAGSPSVQALLRYFHERLGPIRFEILTLLDGDRDIRHEIHKKEFFKPMSPQRVERAVSWFRTAIRSAAG